jgi:GNAT superfamily N-acetyltransferase
MQIVEATSPDHLAAIRELFVEYASSLETDLCFQNFQQEIDSLPGEYSPPRGRLLLARPVYPKRRITPPRPIGWEPSFAGCVGLRPLDGPICEMKRLYVRPECRGHGLGCDLVQTVIAVARQVGYTTMRLDTLDSMKKAQALYRSLGFKPIEPYYHNPTPGVMFMELALS